jgi:hypothetical protein
MNISYDSIINNIENEKIEIIAAEFQLKMRVRINNILKQEFAELLYKQAYLEKNWVLSSGINKNKYEKADNAQKQKANGLQAKNVGNAFGKNEFSYIFYRTMNNVRPAFPEYMLRKILGSGEFIDFLNRVTGLELKMLTTLFMSKYKSGNFLSPHSDKGNGRLAFVINLSKNWKPQYGGNLHFLNESRNEIIDSYVPDFNNLVLFYVPEPNGIPHYVSHIAPNIPYSRYAISGWFM